MLVHIFGATDSPCCANFPVKTIARDNIENYSPITIETVLRSFYGEDLLKLVLSEQEAVSLITDKVDLIKSGGFRTTKFISNNEHVMKSIPEMERAKSLKVQALIVISKKKHLKWNVVKDSFIFESLTCETEEVTKRAILKIVASIFDPSGFVSPFVLTAKIFLQELWRIKLDWDKIIDDNLKREWQKWQGELKNVSKVKTARDHHPIGNRASDIELNVFCDASQKSSGAVAFPKFQFMKEKPYCSFVIKQTSSYQNGLPPKAGTKCSSSRHKSI